MNKLALVFGLTFSLSAGAAQAQTSVRGFVTRSGTRLTLDGKPFRFAGANIYWLGQDRLDGKLVYPTHFRIDDALDTAQRMGATVVRVETLGESTGNPLSIEPALGVFNEAAFEPRDYAVTQAAKRGIRLIAPLVDNWHYSQGGKHHFTDWRGLSDPKVEDPSSAGERKFYTDPQVIADFKQYVGHVLNHVNQYTKIAYKDDPTILCWETGDELQYCPGAWTKDISDDLKRLAPHTLVMDGKNQGDGFDGYPWEQLTSVDIESPHYHNEDLAKDAALFASHGKATIVGEFKWNAPVDLASYLAAVENNPDLSGDLYWSLFGHRDDFGFEQHDDNLTLHFPGDTPDMKARAALLRAHAYKMRGLPIASPAPPAAPLITSVTHQGNDNLVAWRGASGAGFYTVDRTTGGPKGDWAAIGYGGKPWPTDNDAPWADRAAPAGPVWYRVRAYNADKVPGPYSPVYRVAPMPK